MNKLTHGEKRGIITLVLAMTVVAGIMVHKSYNSYTAPAKEWTDTAAVLTDLNINEIIRRDSIEKAEKHRSDSLKRVAKRHRADSIRAAKQASASNHGAKTKSPRTPKTYPDLPSPIDR